jgi:RNase P subunit RPR2
MDFTQEDSQRIIAWLNSHSVSAECPSCKTNNRWEIGDKIIYDKATPFINTRVSNKTILPLVYLVCGHCGFIRYYSAEKIGLLPSYWKPTESNIPIQRWGNK